MCSIFFGGSFPQCYPQNVCSVDKPVDNLWIKWPFLPAVIPNLSPTFSTIESRWELPILPRLPRFPSGSRLVPWLSLLSALVALGSRLVLRVGNHAALVVPWLSCAVTLSALMRLSALVILSAHAARESRLMLLSCRDCSRGSRLSRLVVPCRGSCRAETL